MSGYGGGLSVQNTPTFLGTDKDGAFGSVTMTENSAYRGGAVVAYGATTLKAQSGYMAENSAKIGGFAYATGAKAEILIQMGTSVQCNAATSYGGAIALNKSTLTIDGGGLSRNYIYDPGKTVYGEAVDAQNGAKVYLKKGSIRGDVDDLGDAKTLNGGGISLRTDSLFEMLDGSISDCFASSGGAIWSSASTVNIYGGNINYNTAHTHGGGIYGVNSTICISNTTSDYGRTTSKFFDNVAVSGGGGAVCVKSSTLEIGGDNTQITGNVGTSAGAIHVTSGSTLNFNSGTISENCSTGTTAGGVHVSTDCIMNMRGGTISNNICGVISSDDKSFDPEHTYAQGGGLYVTNNAVFTMTGGVIANNIANPLSTKESIGGNVFVQTDGHFVFEGGEISGDATTLQAVIGGGIGGSGDIKISGGTIKDCVATFGGAIGNYGGFVLTLIDPDNNSTYDVDYVGQLAISGSPTISGNVAQTGNGIFSSGDVTLDGNVEIADMIYLAGVQLVEGAEANGELAGMSTTHAIPKITLSGTGEAKYKIKFVDAIFDVFDYAIRIDGSSNANTLSAIVGAQADGHSNDVKSEIASFSGEGEVDFLSMLDFFDIDETAFAKAVIDGSLHLFEDGTTLVYVSCNDDGIRVEQGTGTGYLLNGTNQATEIEVSDDFVVYGIMTEGFKGLGVTQILMPVTANTKIKVVGESAFADCTNLELVELTGENFAIDASVFDGCTSLNYIKFLGCGSIEDGAFDGVSLSNITLSGDGLEIGQSTFLSSKLTLESLEVGKIKSVGERSFYNFQALLTAVVNAENIGSYAFAESQKLSEVNVVDNGEFDITLGDKVFYACPLLERASIGCRETAFASETENSISLGVDVFRDCPVLSSAVIGNAVKTIPEGLFRSCVMLREVSLPLSFDSIAFAAFYQAGKDISWGDYGLEIVLPTDGSLKSINRRAFMQSAIGGLLLPESVETIGEGAFGSCANLSGEVRIPNSVTTLGASSFANDSKITALIIGTGISSLSTTVFAGCTGITSLTVNGQIEGGISASMFGECRNLEILTTASDVAANGFLDKTNLLSLAFLNGVQRIGASAFECCYGIRGAIYLPDSLVEIDDDAFYACDSITSIRLSPNIEEISSGVFSCCSILENVNWSELGCLRQIANSAFECTGLVSIELPSGLETIGEYAFVDCAILSGDLLIPSSVETIADGAFAGTALTNVFASDQDTSSLVMIGYACFERCASLTSATIVGNGCAIGASVFANCSALESVSFKGVLSLDESVFTGDTLLNVCIEGVIDDGQVFASGVTITSETFIGSKETLETLSLVCKNVTGSAFNGFTNLKTISKLNAETIGSYAFANCNALEGELEIISNNIGETGGRAFYECNSLAKVTAASVEVLGPLTFNSCDNLAEVNIGGTYSIVPDRIFNSCASLQKVVLNDSYTSIAYRAFNGCSSLTSFVVADGVSSIGDEAFNGCSGLTQADIDCAITTVPVKLFSGCSSLQTVTMPSNVTDIYFGAFHGCSALSQINLPDTLQKIHARAFMGAGLTALTIPASVTEIGTAFTNSSGTTYSGSSFRSCPITSLTVNTSALTISLSMFGGYSSLQTLSTASSVAADGFQDITSLKSLFFKAGVTSIGASAFSGCTELTSLSFTSSITTIGESAFSGCTGVSGSLSLSNVTSLGAGAFQNCSSITGATLSTELTAIPSFLFSGCSKLETTNLSSLSSLTSIGESAFANCCELVTIEIPDSVTSIGECAFYYCLKLEEVFIPKSVTDIGESAFVQLASDELIYVEAESKPAGWHEYWGLVSWILYGATKTEFREDGVVKVYCLQVY